MASGVWDMASGEWHMASGEWYMASGLWDIWRSGTWHARYMESGIPVSGLRKTGLSELDSRWRLPVALKSRWCLARGEAVWRADQRHRQVPGNNCQCAIFSLFWHIVVNNN